MAKKDTTQYETLRWPTNLDRAAIELRLGQVRDYALANGLPELAARFEHVSSLTGGQLGGAGGGPPNPVQKPPHPREAPTQLEMVAMNLKNRKYLHSQGAHPGEHGTCGKHASSGHLLLEEDEGDPRREDDRCFPERGHEGDRRL